MKKIAIYIYGILSVASFAFSSCVDQVEMQTSKYPVCLTAQQEGVRSKVAVDGTSLFWEETDKMNVIAVASDGTSASAELSVFEIDAANPRKASFSGFVTMPAEAPRDCYFLYPTGSAMEVNPLTGKITVIYVSQNGNHAPFMYAKTAYDLGGIDTKMKHVGAVLEISVSEALKEKITDISFRGNNQEKLSPIIINPEDGSVTPPSQPVYEISVPVADEGKTYLCVPPLDMPKGFTLICGGPDGKMLKSFSSDGTLSGGYDFSSKTGNIIPITIDGTFEDFAVTCSDPVVTHKKDANGLLMGTEVKFTMSKTGAANKLIQAWGATLSYVKITETGAVEETEIRKVEFDASVPITGQDVVMNIENNWKLIPGGTYVFAPYCKMYGQTNPEGVSLESRSLIVTDPGVRITIDGATSYDYYRSYLSTGNTNDLNTANGFTNTEIRDVAVSVNIHSSILDSFVSSFNGTTMTPSSGSLPKYYYTNLPVSEFKRYQMKVAIRCGYHTFNAERDFEITGLPLEAVFSNNPDSWNPRWSYLGIAGYSNTWVTFKKGTGALKSPKFNVPSNLSIKVAIDAHTNCSNSSDRVLFLNTCPDNQSSAITSSNISYTPKKSSVLADNLKSQGYSSWLTGLTLSSQNNSLMFSNVIDDESFIYLNQTRVGIFKVKIQYN